jgi:hypothetical protein
MKPSTSRSEINVTFGVEVISSKGTGSGELL